MQKCGTVEGTTVLYRRGGGRETGTEFCSLQAGPYSHTVLGSSLGTISPVFWADSFQNVAHRLPAQSGKTELTLLQLNQEFSLRICILWEIPGLCLFVFKSLLNSGSQWVMAAWKEIFSPHSLPFWTSCSHCSLRPCTHVT